MDILPNKFGEFLVLLAGGIMITACKKEEKAMPTNQFFVSSKVKLFTISKTLTNRVSIHTVLKKAKK